MTRYRKSLGARLQTAVPFMFLLPTCDAAIDNVADARPNKNGTGA